MSTHHRAHRATGRVLAALAIALAACLPAAAEDVVYTEGDSRVRYVTGEQLAAQIGDILGTGDSVRTGGDGFVEIEDASAIIRVAPDTVFTISERAVGEEKRTTLAVALGSANFKFQRFTGSEPQIATLSVVAGVRGTEFSVYAGADGSSVITVDEGLVTLAAGGERVELAAEEGVEVPVGGAPGAKFPVKRGQFDYSTWNAQRVEEILRDPLAALDGAERQLDRFIAELDELVPLWEAERAELARVRPLLNAIEDRDQRSAYYRANVLPHEIMATNLFLNIRFSSLSALSLRRFVLGRLYLMLKGAGLGATVDASAASVQYTQYLQRHRQLLDKYERQVVPHLVTADI